MDIKFTASGLEHDLGVELNVGEGHGSPQPNGNNAVMKVMERYMDPLTFNLEDEDFRPILRLVTDSLVRPFVPGPMGVDGVTYTLTISESFSTATFQWWVETADGWKPLDAIAQAIINLARKKLGRPFQYWAPLP